MDCIPHPHAGQGEGAESAYDFLKGSKEAKGWKGAIQETALGGKCPQVLLCHLQSPDKKGHHPDSLKSAYHGPQTTPPRLRLYSSPHPDESTVHPSQGHSLRISGGLRYLCFTFRTPGFCPCSPLVLELSEDQAGA